MCFTETPGPCVTGCFEGCCGCPSAATVAMVLAIALSNRECKGPSAGIKGIQSQKFGLLLDLLPDELIETGALESRRCPQRRNQPHNLARAMRTARCDDARFKLRDLLKPRG